jgi:hypothetical protein
MRAAQHQGVHFGALQRFQVALGQAENLPSTGDAPFDEVDEPRAGHRGHLEIAGGVERILISAGVDGRGGVR